MILNCETILYFYTHKSKQILCQIKANPKRGNFKTTCRCLSEDQWVTFDNKLEKILMEKEFWKDDKWIKFSIDPAIEIKIKKSKLSLTHFGSWLDVNIDCNKQEEKGILGSNLVLECLIDFKLAINILPGLQGSYEPQMEAVSNGTVPYEPYTPSKNTFQTDNGKVIKNSLKNVYVSNEDTYTPKPLITISTVDSISTNLIPKYTPAPINSKRRSKERYKCSQSNIKNEIGKDKSLGTNLNKNWKARESEYVPKCEEVTKINVPIYIPTPIEQTKLLKISKEDNIRRNKKRSNTIDVFPEQFDENTKEKQISEIEELNNKIESHCYNKMLKKRHLTIDEIPAALSNACFNNPISAAEEINQNVLKTCNRSKNVKSVNIEQLDTNTKQTYTAKKEEINNNEKLAYGQNANLNKCFASIEKVQTSLDEEFKNKVRLHKPVVKEIDSNQKSSEDKFVINSKWPLKVVSTGSDKTEESKEMISGFFDSTTQHNEIKSNSTVDVRSKMNKSLRRSDRSSSKPKRLVEEQPNCFSSNKNKSKKYKFSHKNKELFGTDDEDNDIDGFDNNYKIYATANETPLIERSYKCNLPSTSAKLNRKKDKIGESCQGKDDVKKRSSKI